MSKKSPFRTYTTEQILTYEAVTYVIVAGPDFFNVDGNYFFTKKSAIRYHNKILRQLATVVNSGTKKDQKNAKKILHNLRIEPMRMH